MYLVVVCAYVGRKVVSRIIEANIWFDILMDTKFIAQINPKEGVRALRTSRNERGKLHGL
jgi:hypothetical protein